LRGEGEAKAIEIYNAAHSKDPAFYQLLKTLDTYRTILDEQTTVVLSADSPLLKLLTQGLPDLPERPYGPDRASPSGVIGEQPATGGDSKPPKEATTKAAANVRGSRSNAAPRIAPPEDTP
jgi:membrane protease subunit HflC